MINKINLNIYYAHIELVEMQTKLQRILLLFI